MRILVTSDTHCKNPAQVESLLDLLRRFAAGVDLILHAGDLVISDVIDALGELAPVHAVRGNMDVTIGAALPEREIVEAGGMRIGLTHGTGPPFGLVERVLRGFGNDDVDAIVFGHTHEPFLQTVEGVLMLNPGSPTDRRFTDHNSIAIATVEDSISAQIIDLPR